MQIKNSIEHFYFDIEGLKIMDFNKFKLYRYFPKLKTLHFECLDSYEKNEKIKRRHAVIDEDLSDNVTVKFSSVLNFSFKGLKVLKLINVFLTKDFFKNLYNIDCMPGLEEINFR